MCNEDCEDPKMRKRRQIQVSYNSGGYSVTITSDYDKEDIDFLTTKTNELIKGLKEIKRAVM